jgi:hypothetical protein
MILEFNLLSQVIPKIEQVLSEIQWYTDLLGQVSGITHKLDGPLLIPSLRYGERKSQVLRIYLTQIVASVREECDGETHILK